MPKTWKELKVVNGYYVNDYSSATSTIDCETKEELIALLDRLYTESGGEGRWRMLQLEGRNAITSSWNLKYLRIQRYNNGFVVCNNTNYALNKEVLASKVEQKYLNFIKD